MTDIEAALARLARQEQFLDVVSSAEATARFHRHLELRPLGGEAVPLSQALNRVLAQAVIAAVDVPGFDRASVDGFAVRASDTIGAGERTPRLLELNREGCRARLDEHSIQTPDREQIVVDSHSIDANDRVLGAVVEHVICIR